jgi:hypothetical protein
MTTWNYRIVKYNDGSGFGLHEVMYDEAGLAWAMTESPATFVASADDGAQEVVDALALALDDANKREVFEEPEDGKWPGRNPGELGQQP